MTVPTAVSDVSAAKASNSPSGSVKYCDRSRASSSPGKMFHSGIVSDTTGARFGTVTGKLCSAERPPGSVAVTTTAASPGATADTTALSAASSTFATAASEVATV